MINPLKRVEVNRYILRHPGVDHRTEGMRIAHVTDVHLGRWIKPRHVEALAVYVNASAPDLTVLTGDYVGYRRRDIAPCVASLGMLEGPVFATLGNHDHWACTRTTLGAFERHAIPVLSNRSVQMTTVRGHSLQVIGVDDAVTRNHDIERAFGEVDADGFRLVLCHVPELGPRVAQAGGHLILSGHTHGLQFNIPRVTEPIAARFGMKYIQGAYALDEACMLYVSRGLGSASWPWRIRASPELSFFELAAGPRVSLSLHERTTIELAPSPRRQRKLRRALEAGEATE